MKDLIFFADKGLTSTSANHVANLAKEYIQQNESILNNITFYQKEVALIGSSSRNILQVGVNTVEDIPELLKEVAEAKSLIAWLREAIKAKDRLMQRYEVMADTEYIAANNIKYPNRPVAGNILTEDEYYSNLSIKERNRYYALETEAAVIGKYIHPEGKFATARQELSNYIQKPNSVSGSGRDTVIYSYIPTISIEDVDEMFFKLQTKHREIQAQLNSIKYQCEQAIIASKTEVQEKYALELREYNSAVQNIEAEIEAYKTKKLREIGNYKIVIPDSLVAIYEKVSKLGK